MLFSRVRVRVVVVRQLEERASDRPPPPVTQTAPFRTEIWKIGSSSSQGICGN